MRGPSRWQSRTRLLPPRVGDIIITEFEFACGLCDITIIYTGV